MSSKRFSMTVTLFILIALIMTVWLGGGAIWRFLLALHGHH